MSVSQARTSRKTLLTSCLLVSAVLLFVPPEWTQPLQVSFRQIFRWPLQWGQGLPSLSAPSTQKDNNSPNTAALEARVLELENQLANLQADLAIEQARNTQLAGIRLNSGWENSVLIHSDALMERDSDSLIINRGKLDNLCKGLLAVADSAVVGCISEVANHQSTLLLATHPDCSILVVLEKTGAIGKLDGAGQGLMHLRLKREYDIQIGHAVYAQKQPGILDVPLIVGRITEFTIDKEHPSLWDVRVAPVARLHALQKVGVSVIRLLNEP